MIWIRNTAVKYHLFFWLEKVRFLLLRPTSQFSIHSHILIVIQRSLSLGCVAEADLWRWSGSIFQVGWLLILSRICSFSVHFESKLQCCLGSFHWRWLGSILTCFLLFRCLSATFLACVFSPLYDTPATQSHHRAHIPYWRRQSQGQSTAIYWSDDEKPKYLIEWWGFSL